MSTNDGVDSGAGSQNLNSGDEDGGSKLDLESLSVVDQDALEQQVAKEADEALRQQDIEQDEKRLEKTVKTYETWQGRVKALEDRIAHPGVRISAKEKARAEILGIEKTHLAGLERDIKDIKNRLSNRKKESDESKEETGKITTAARLPGESEREFLVRTGKITPFAKWTGEKDRALTEVLSHKQLKQPGEELMNVDQKRQKFNHQAPSQSQKVVTVSSDESEDEDQEYNDEDGEYSASTDGSDEQLEDIEPEVGASDAKEKDHFKRMDDGDEYVYQHRLKKWIAKRRAFRAKMSGQNATFTDDSKKPEWERAHPTEPDHVIDDLRIPGDVYSCLFEYQKTGVQWLWELHTQKVGGIVGDEMGLGKTVQIAAFLAALHHSRKLDKPVLIVCPVTVMKQWVSELHRWWPPLRVAILHSIGSGMSASDSRTSDSFYNISDDEEPQSRNQASAKVIVNRIFSGGHVIVTTYSGMKVYSRYLLPKQWAYCVLDEGHKIRNPNSEVSLYCKQVKTPHRIILSGTPIQNNLKELWSLFDFVFPARLGTLPVFENQFAIPINVGGYANATNVQVQTAYKCAVVLRDLISPYMLRRMKADVAADLPSKQEKVLFCRLTQFQADAYRAFLSSDEMKSILTGKRQVLFGIDILRKICNHPDLVDRDMVIQQQGLLKYGQAAKSGKMQVLKALIDLWKSQGHKVLLFTQTRQMLDILERFVDKLNVTYLRMDGSTPIIHRHGLVERFNTDLSLDIFLLTTKVGGLGVNLTGANRVIIFDPDWNPSTDIQARERAWRLGQKREVMIYRLLTAGTIEEKIYHRQIFKQFLTNKILKDPRQRRFFKTGDLHDLFSLGESDVGGTETGGMFSGAEKRISAKTDVGAKPNSIIYPGSNERIEYHHKEQPAHEDDLQQLSQLNGVAGLEDYRPKDEKPTNLDKSERNHTKGSKPNEDAILEGIFAKSGVSSTLEHDAIMDASRPETMLIEREASRVAMLAAKALKESRQAASGAKIGTPTWTGKFGEAGKRDKLSRSPTQLSTSPGPRRLGLTAKASDRTGTMSSKNLLAQMSKKRALEAKDAKQLVRDPTVRPQAETLQLICEYFSDIGSAKDYKASSKDIVQHCKVSMRDAQEVATLRQMLRQVAYWVKDENVWQLKEEFR